MERFIDVVFDGPPGPESGRFVEVENEKGQSINAGTWMECPEDNMWRLRLKVHPGLDNLAAMINQTSSEHGFWPDNYLEKQALEYLVDHAKDSSVAADDKIRDAARLLFGKLKESRNMGEMLMLATSELAEALEEHREGKPPVYFVIKITPQTTFTEEAMIILDKLRDAHDLAMLQGDQAFDPDLSQDEWKVLVDSGIAKPEGAAVELMDTIIRCLDTMYDMLKSEPYSIEAVAQLKMRYNETRPYKHGKAY